MPRHILQGIQDAFRRAGYSEVALGLSSVSSIYLPSYSLARAAQPPATTVSTAYSEPAPPSAESSHAKKKKKNRSKNKK